MHHHVALVHVRLLGSPNRDDRDRARQREPGDDIFEPRGQTLFTLRYLGGIAGIPRDPTGPPNQND